MSWTYFFLDLLQGELDKFLCLMALQLWAERQQLSLSSSLECLTLDKMNASKNKQNSLFQICQSKSFGQWAVVPGKWTVDMPRPKRNPKKKKIKNTGPWTVDSRDWTVYNRQSTVDSGQQTLDCGQWTMNTGNWTLHCGQWTVDSRHGQGALDSKHSTVQKKRPLFFKLDCLPRRASKWKMHFLVLVLKFGH